MAENRTDFAGNLKIVWFCKTRGTHFFQLCGASGDDLVLMTVLAGLKVPVIFLCDSTDRCASRKASRKKSVEKRSARPTTPETLGQRVTV